MSVVGEALIAALIGFAASTSLGALAPAAVQTSTTVGRFELHVPVLYYHRISCYPDGAPAPGDYTCPAVFESQLTYIRDHGWRAITVDQLADLMTERRCPEPRTFVVSFDDGALDNYQVAAPILERLGMRGSFFVNAGLASKAGRMTFAQMRDLVERGHAIGNHGLTHLSLPGQPADVLYEQIEGAQQLLDTELGFRPRTFAYPYGRYGRYTDTVIQAVRDSGFELAFTVVRGAREASDAPLLSRRLRFTTTNTGEEALSRIEPFVDGCPPATADLAVALSKTGPFRGNNVYSPLPVKAQTVTRTDVKSGQTYPYWVRLENDGQFADAFRISAYVTGPAADVRFLVSGVDVTQQIRNGTYVTGQRQPWSSMLLTVRVTPGPGSAGQAIAVVVRAVPLSMPDRLDTGRLRAVY
ncbi:MAG: polysaccharide deacetylase family protein [Chloroflexota bacterium]